MQQLIVAVSLGLAMAAGSFVQQQAPRASDRRNHDVYVSVLDSRGKPVPGLTAKDFTVREDNVAREVLDAKPATDQLTISMLVDDSQAATEAIQFIRDGLNAFVAKMAGKADIAIATFGERPTSVVDFTSSTEVLKRGISKIFHRSGSGSYLLDGIVEVSRGLQKREAPRKHIVVITTEGVEFSNRQYQQVLEVLASSGATLHSLSLGQPSSSLVDEMRNRNITIAEGTERTGGRRDQVLALSGLPDRLTQLADELLNQYQVTYGRPEQLIPPEKIQVTVSKPDVTVRARTRLADK